MSDSELTPKKKRDVIIYLVIIFAAAFVLILISMFVRMRTMQEDFDTAKGEAASSYAQQESELFESVSSQNDEHRKAMTAMERKAYASELLVLAQKAYYEGNERNFQGYMASLEGYADALGEETLKIYEELASALRG